MTGFDLKKGVSQVTLSVAEQDEDLVVNGYFETDDPNVIRALDDNDFVKRSSGKEDADQPVKAEKDTAR